MKPRSVSILGKWNTPSAGQDNSAPVRSREATAEIGWCLSSVCPREVLRLRFELHTFIEWEHWPLAELVTEASEVCNGRARGVDIDEPLRAVGKELRLTMRDFTTVASKTAGSWPCARTASDRTG